MCELCEEKVCRFFAELLLRAGRRFAYQDFLDTWQQSVPMGMITSLDHLKVRICPYVHIHHFYITHMCNTCIHSSLDNVPPAWSSSRD